MMNESETNRQEDRPMTARTHRFLVTYADSATVGMSNRQETISAPHDAAAYAAAKLRMRDGEFIRGVQRIEDDEEGPSAPPQWRYMTQDEEREIYGYVEE